jgi:hypothetical protein
MRPNRLLALAGAAVLSACGAGAGTDDGELAALQDFQAVGAELSTVVATYGTAAAALADPAECAPLHAGYADHAGRLAARMREAGEAMERHMASHGSMGPGDTTCGADAVLAELERHRAAACTGPDVDADGQEAARHVATMAALMEHQRVRYEEAGARMGMMGPSGDGTFTCERREDGSFEMDGRPWEPGTSPCDGAQEPAPAPWPMPCGDGVCDGDHPMMR